MAEGTITSKEYMEKLEGFIKRRTDAVLGSNSSYALRKLFDESGSFSIKNSKKAARGDLNRRVKKEWKHGKNQKTLYNLEETIAKDLFEGAVYPWEVLPKISDFIKKLGATLSEEEYEKRGEDIWIAKSATVAPTAYIHGPAIIGKEAEVRHCAFIRGNAIVGEGAVVGNSTELKNVVLFNKVQVPHYNYVGDSILDTRHIWEPVRSHPMSNPIKNWWW